MHLTCSSCVRRRLAAWWNPAVCLLVLCVCGVARGEEQTESPSLEPEKSTIQLEARVEEACVGGRGRFFIARLRDRREIIVLDLFKRFVSFTIPLGDDDVEFAAGLTRLHIVAPDSGLFQTWNLRTGERLREAAWPLNGHVKKIAMGSGNDRRLAVCFADSPHREDPIQWATIEFPLLTVQPWTIADGVPVNDLRLQAATGGSLFVAWPTQDSARERGVVLIQQSQADWLTWMESPGYVLPNESGSHLLTDAGVFTLQLTEDLGLGLENVTACVPAETGQMYLTQSSQDDADVWRLRSLDRRAALATIRIDEDFSGRSAATVSKLGQPFIFSAEAGYIAALTGTTEVAVYKLDLSNLPTDD